MSEPSELSIVAGEPISSSAGRILTAWLTEKEATTALLGRNRAPGVDLGPLAARYAEARAAVAARPEFRPEDVLVEAERGPLEEIAAREDTKNAFAGIDWSVEMVDLLQVQSVQKSIKIDRLAERMAPVIADRSQLYEFCLPSKHSPPPRAAFTDPDQRGFTVSSLNPNLRVVGTKVTNVELASPTGTTMVQAVMFFVNFGNSFMNVARYRGRFFLRDGYHRVTGLLEAGITVAPCVVINFAGYWDDLMPGRDVFSREVCFADRPPLVSDFLDPTVSDEYRMPLARKVIRIRSEEFVIQG